VSVGIAGSSDDLAGVSHLVSNLQLQTDKLWSRWGVRVVVRAIADGQRMVLSDAGIDLAAWKGTSGSNPHGHAQ
jgi:hypothetical protein